MSRLQRLIIALLPTTWAAAAEAESRSWILTCPRCGSSRSLWEHGGIRWKGTSTKRMMAAWCGSCGQRQTMALHRIEPPDNP
ncbi:MAG: hypothetical protein AB4911_15990 [Oscillochloridaceae bacterium umkhey_bin13]